MRRLLPILPLLILVLLTLVSLYFGFVHPKPASTPGLEVLEGEVIFISPSWTTNGDGNIAISAERPPVLVHTVVAVTGYPSQLPTTALTMNVRYIKDLLHHRVRVTGVQTRRCFRALSIEQLD